MEQVKEIKGKKNLITKTWERCKSLACDDASEGGGRGRRSVAPKGCFSVYVGAEKRKFVVRTKLANHPLFRVLLEQVEAEYGYNSCGPIVLPCDIEIFYRVLREMDDSDVDGTRRSGSLCRR